MWREIIDYGATSTLFPNATMKLFEIINMLKIAKPERDGEFIQSMAPFAQTLKTVLLDFNQKLYGIDRDISYLGGILYDDLTWSANPAISEIASSWSRLVGPGILEPDEVKSRIRRDSERFAFFSELRNYCQILHDAEVYLVNKKEKEEQEARIQAKKAAAEEARRAKVGKAVKEMDEIRAQEDEEARSNRDVIALIKINISEEQSIAMSKEAYRNAQKMWKKVFASHALVSRVKALQKLTGEGVSPGEKEQSQGENKTVVT